MKRMVGGIILATLLVFWVCITCVAYGVKTGLIIWAIALAITLIIAFAIFLITDG